jgi:hypothetical protein
MEPGRQRFLRLAGLSALVLVALSALFWTNLSFVNANPGGNDFLPRWVGAKQLIEKNISPYAIETTAQIQQVLYGRPALEGEDQAFFAYPIHATILIFPFAQIESFALARAAWLTVSVLSIFILAIVSIRISGWQPRRFVLAIFLGFAILWYHGAKPLIDGNLSVLIALFVWLAIAAIKSDKDVWAGTLLAMATIKPQMVFWLIPFTLIWAYSTRRRIIIVSFLFSMASILLIFWIVQPTWIFENISQIREYPNYAPAGNLAEIFENWWGSAAVNIAWGLSLLTLVALLREWWLALGKSFDKYLWTFCLTLALAPFLGIPTTTSNFIIMLPIFPVVFEAWERRLTRQSQNFALAIIVITFLGLWFLFINTLLPGQQFSEHLVMFFPVPILLLVNLVWLKWGMLRIQEPTYPAQKLQIDKDI